MTLYQELKEHQEASGADDAQLLQILCDFIPLQLHELLMEYVHERLDGINMGGMLMSKEDFNETAERHG